MLFIGWGQDMMETRFNADLQRIYAGGVGTKVTPKALPKPVQEAFQQQVGQSTVEGYFEQVVDRTKTYCVLTDEMGSKNALIVDKKGGWLGNADYDNNGTVTWHSQPAQPWK